MNWLSIFLVPCSSSSTAFYPQSGTNQGMCPNFSSLCCLHFWTRNWVHQGVWRLCQLTYVTFFLTFFKFVYENIRKSKRPFYQNFKLNNETSQIKWKTKWTHHKLRWQKTYDWKKFYKKHVKKDNCYTVFHLHKVHTIILKEIKIQKNISYVKKKNDQLCKNSWLIKRCEMKCSINKKMDNIRHHTIPIAW